MTILITRGLLNQMLNIYLTISTIKREMQRRTTKMTNSKWSSLPIQQIRRSRTQKNTFIEICYLKNLSTIAYKGTSGWSRKANSEKLSLQMARRSLRGILTITFMSILTSSTWTKANATRAWWTWKAQPFSLVDWLDLRKMVNCSKNRPQER
jgi:hypothetical protein